MSRTPDRQQVVRLLLPFFTFHFVSHLSPAQPSHLACLDRILGTLCHVTIWIIVTCSLYQAEKRLSGGAAGQGSLVNRLIFALPFEVHLPGHNFTGPGTRLGRRMGPDLRWLEASKPVNKVDQASYEHDVGYLLAETSLDRARLDDELIDAMDDILEVREAVSARERVEAHVVKVLMNLKSLLRSF